MNAPRTLYASPDDPDAVEACLDELERSIDDSAADEQMRRDMLDVKRAQRPPSTEAAVIARRIRQCF
jgi:hypothetical protein